jgi:hypothetical protein
MVHTTRDFLKLDRTVDPDGLCIWLVCRSLIHTITRLNPPQDYACINQDDPTYGVTTLPTLLAQCNAVIRSQMTTITMMCIVRVYIMMIHSREIVLKVQVVRTSILLRIHVLTLFTLSQLIRFML